MQYLNKEFIGGLSGRLDTEEELISEIKDRSIERIQNELHRENNNNNKKQEHLGTLSVQYICMESQKKTRCGENIFRDDK